MNLNEKPVTSFDLEPNPFEQSFASTKKGPAAAVLESAAAADDKLAGSSALDEVVQPSNGVSQSQNAAETKNRIPGTDFLKSPLLYGATSKPPTIHSPTVSSPGGSRRLPPLNLSPNANMASGLAAGAAGQASPSVFYLNLPKTGLTPNESNIRSGLTPAVAAAAQGGAAGTIQAGSNGHNSLSAIPVALTSSTGLTPGRFSPMLNSLLNIPSAQPALPVVQPNNLATTAGGSIGVDSVDQQKEFTTISGTNGIVAHVTNTNGRSPASSSANNSNGMSAHSSVTTTYSLLSNGGNAAPKEVLSASINLDKMNTTAGMMKSVYNNNENLNDQSQHSRSAALLTDSSIRHPQVARTQRKRKADNSLEPKPQLSINDSSHNAAANGSPNEKHGSKKRKGSTGGGKSKSTTNTAKHSQGNPNAHAENNTGGEGSEGDEAQRRKEFLERNRIAASRFRRRKKEYIKRIEEDVSFYESEYNDMTACLASLTGITPDNSTSMGNPSLINSLKQALITQDLKSALQLCDMLEHTVLNTRYVQRNGVNPRESVNRSDNMDDSDS